MLKLGPYSHESRVVVAPMAGVTDRPFRDLCREFGSHWLVSEMVTSDQRLWQSRKSKTRLAHHDEKGLSWVQLAGAEPGMMADAAARNVELGADIIDINMGCPARKVCNKAAGSALMRDEALVQKILDAVAGAVAVPVTLKLRLGWSRDEINAPIIAAMAEDAGFALVTVHGRSRADRFQGTVDYDAIGEVKRSVSLPIIANGDITSPEQAGRVLQVTGADGVMIGRAAQGRPWLPSQIDEYLATGRYSAEPTESEIADLMCRHLDALHKFYGEFPGVRIARKHIGWTLDGMELGELKRHFHQLVEPAEQINFIHQLREAA